MTDAERNIYFEDKKKETIDRILGPNLNLPVPEDIIHKDVDQYWKSGKSWHDRPRTHKDNMNSTLTYAHAASLLERDSGGYIVHVEHIELSADSTQKSAKS